MLTDSNCVQIMMSSATAESSEGTPACAERIGNVAREEAAILTEFMDDHVSDFLDYAIHNVDYKFACTLSEDLNHKAAGYKIEIILNSNKSEVWIEKIIELLLPKDIFAIKIED